jgi:hypothetical protein
MTDSAGFGDGEIHTGEPRIGATEALTEMVSGGFCEVFGI